MHSQLIVAVLASKSRHIIVALTLIRAVPIVAFRSLKSIIPDKDLASERDLNHEHWMREALRLAQEARAAGEVPVGTCVVADDQILAAAGNRTRTDCDPTAHAEIVALREAARKFGNYRLADAVVYTTIEPCAMCAGALIQARIPLLVYGAVDEKAGAIDSHFHVCDSDHLNHRVQVIRGVLEAECRGIMQEFFREKRKSTDEGMKEMKA
jgi:tRNA(adenine34) deaminase